MFSFRVLTSLTRVYNKFPNNNSLNKINTQLNRKKCAFPPRIPILIEAGKTSKLNPHEQRKKKINEHWFPFPYKALSYVTLFQFTQNYKNQGTTRYPNIMLQYGRLLALDEIKD